MEPEILHPSWPFIEAISSDFDQFESYGFNLDVPMMGDSGFSPLLNTSEDSSSSLFSNDHFQYPIDEHTLHLPPLMEAFSMDLDAFDPTFTSEHILLGINGYPEASEGSFPLQNLSSETEDAWSPIPSMKSDMSTVLQPHQSLTLPEEDMEMENQLSLPHLLEAIGEAMEQGHHTLAQVILRCISHKVSPLGDTLERLAFNLSQNHNPTDQGNFIKQEACKNLKQIFKAFYHGLPHGKIAHFTANSAILESIPEDSEPIHIIDFDLGGGVQWVPLIEAIAFAHQHKTLKLTSIKWEEEESPEPDCVSTFEETRRNLCEYARSCGLKLKVEEKGMEELVTELKKQNKRGGNGNGNGNGKGKRDFLAFNCMVGLPHMGRVRSRRQVSEFLRVAKNFIKTSKGIITFGDGEACERLRNCLDFRSFFHGNLVHYQALLESIESKFPNQFSEIRTVMEGAFVWPYVSALGWFQKWEEMREDWEIEDETGLEGGRLREGVLMEVGEMLRGSEGWYEAKVEGKNMNEVVLEWKQTQLLRVTIWGK